MSRTIAPARSPAGPKRSARREPGYLAVVTTTEPAIAAQPGSDETVLFGGLEIRWDARVLRPRPWTVAQSHWAAALSRESPDGPILELCCGAGQIGLLAAAETGRALVQVDRDPVATDYARRNAAAAGVTADVRTASLAEALADDERFPLIVLDPPWVRSADVPCYPEDPVTAIDGGVTGSDHLLLGIGVALRHLAAGGHLVVQVGTPDQVELVERVVGGVRAGACRLLEVRDYRPAGLLLAVGVGRRARSALRPTDG